MAIRDLEAMVSTWPTLPEQLITTRVGYKIFSQALDFRSEDDIKTVVVWE